MVTFDRNLSRTFSEDRAKPVVKYNENHDNLGRFTFRDFSNTSISSESASTVYYEARRVASTMGLPNGDHAARSAVERYSSDLNGINGSLRDGSSDRYMANPFFSGLDPLRYVEPLDRAVNSYQSSAPITVFRGDTRRLGLKPGDLIDNRGYTSTSTLPGAAEFFADNDGSGENYGSLFRVNVPQGTSMTTTGAYREAELLLGRDTTMRVDRADVLDNGTEVYEVTVVPSIQKYNHNHDELGRFAVGTTVTVGSGKAEWRIFGAVRDDGNVLVVRDAPRGSRNGFTTRVVPLSNLSVIEKYNPYHDPEDGRFTTGEGGVAAVTTRVQEQVGIIEGTTGVRLRPARVDQGVTKGSAGTYYPESETISLHEVNTADAMSRGPWEKALEATAAHEVSHHLDYQMGREEGAGSLNSLMDLTEKRFADLYASPRIEAARAFLKAATTTDSGIGKMLRDVKTGRGFTSKTQAKYVSSSHEVFARAMVQYLDLKNGGLYGVQNSFAKDEMRWDDAEFTEKIMPALDAIFAEPIAKYNMNHDELGRFASGSNSKMAEVSARITNVTSMNERSGGTGYNAVRRANYKGSNGTDFVLELRVLGGDPAQRTGANYFVTAYPGSKMPTDYNPVGAGYMRVTNRIIDGEQADVIDMIETYDGYKRQGLATAMLAFARSEVGPVEHSTVLWPDGKAWSAVVKYNPYHDPKDGKFTSAHGLHVAVDYSRLGEEGIMRFKDVDRMIVSNRVTNAEAQVAEAQKYLDTQEVSVNMTNVGLQGILHDGRFKTLHETGESGGNSDTNRRLDVEKDVFNLGYEMPVELRPVYGYLSTPGKHEPSQYGDIKITLKPEVRQRSTFVQGDSLSWGSGVPSPLSATDKHSYLWRFVGEHTGDSLLDVVKNSQYDTFLEVQVHGGVKLSDVAQITFIMDAGDKPEWYHNKPDYTLPAIEASGIPWQIVDDMGNVVESSQHGVAKSLTDVVS